MKAESARDMSRRRFLKTTAAGALTLSAIPTIIIPKRVEAFQPGGKVHPYISPLRVVGATDPGMTSAVEAGANWAKQEQLVVWDAVQQNMDRMAVALAQEGKPADAWGKIFLKPAGKSWSDVVVAIKTNQIGSQRTRSAVMSKVCHVLTALGVKGSNIHIYDAKSGSNMSRETRFQRLPDGVHLANTWGGIAVSTSVPTPYFKGDREAPCLGPLVKGEVDILVNIALCKNHGGGWGQFTMSMKNHFGTFSPKPGHGPGGSADYLIGINKSPEILGQMDPRTGDVLFPRQQLCIVDALWASEKGGPSAPTNAQPNALTMGTFGPALDYVTAMRLRKDTMGWPVRENVAERFLTEFGHTVADLPNGGQIIDAMTTAA